MKEKPVNPLNPLLSRIQRFGSDGDADARWESARVEYTLRCLGREKLLRELQRASTDGKLNFELLRQSLPQFPVALAAATFRDRLPLHRDPLAVHPFWFKSFRSLPFVAKYIELTKLRRSQTSCRLYPPLFGVVFPRRGFREGLIVHNGDWSAFVPAGVGAHLFKLSESETLVVQPYSAFLLHVREGLGEAAHE